MRSWLQAVFLAKSASVQFEPADFNVSAALINNGVDISTIPELAALSRRDAVNGCSIACSALQKIYGDATVLSEGNSEYNEFHGAYWSAQQGAVSPQCVFKPKSSLEVSTLVLVARLSQCQFAVKGGGHAAFAGASSIEDGITVSLENLDTVKVADDKQFVDVGPGNRWIDVYNSIDKQNVGVVGGRMSPVGVSGLTLGGGISFFSNKLGWACDNVASYELVTASGKVINVDQKTYPDMYRALRGGGNNFGVVTNFKMNAFPLGQMWGGQRIYSENNFAAVLDAIHKFSTTGSNTDQDAAQLVSFSAIPQLGNIAIVQMHYAKPTSSAPVFADLNTIPSVMDNTDLGTLGNMTDKMNQGQVDGQRQTMWDISLKVDRELFTYLTTTFYANMASVANIDGIFPIVSIQAITDGQLQGMQKNGGNTLGLDAKKGPYFIMNLSAKWNKASDDEAVMKFMSTFIQQVKAEAQRRGLDNEYIYMNYGSQYQDPIASYGAENVRRLMEVSRKYDPTGVFQTLQPGGFKIGKGVPNPHMP